MNKRIEDLRHEVYCAVRAALDELNRQGVKYAVIETLRPKAVQIAYYLQGRLPDEAKTTLDVVRHNLGLYELSDAEFKKIITWTLSSPHQDGKAVDIMPLRPDGKIDWTKQDDRIVAAFKAKGFIWGGDWKEKDLPHFQYNG